MNILIVAMFGAIIGSFLNVYICRLHTGRTLDGRSHCLSCGTTLSWYELIPVCSYLAQRGRCRHCTAWIATRYLFVELVTMALFVLSFLTSGEPVLTAVLFIVSAALVVTVTYDLMHTIIPDEMVGLLTVAALLLVVIEKEPFLAALGAGVGSALFFWFFWYISKGKWMGLGDAKLAFPLGVLVGPWGAISMIILSFWIGAIVSLFLMTLQAGKTHMPFLPQHLTMKSEIPFAPFLIAGFVCVYFFHVDILTITDFVTTALLGY